MKDKIFSLTPLGRADIQLKEFLGEDEDFYDSEVFRNYEKALNDYRNLKILQIVVKIFLYAGLITSIAASFGLEQLRVINQIASYLGVSFLLIIYVIVNYGTMVQREEYHVKREMLVSSARMRDEEEQLKKELDKENH